MNADEYKDVNGENPGPLNLGNCTGCGMSRGFSEGGGLRCENCGKPWPEYASREPGDTRPAALAPDAVVVPSALLAELDDLLAEVKHAAVYHHPLLLEWVCGGCSAHSRTGMIMLHEAECTIERAKVMRAKIAAALSAPRDDA